VHKLNQIWGEQSSTIAAPNKILWYRHVAQFRNEDDAKTSGVRNRGELSPFLTLVKVWEGWAKLPSGRFESLHPTAKPREYIECAAATRSRRQGVYSVCKAILVHKVGTKTCPEPNLFSGGHFSGPHYFYCGFRL